MTTSGTTMINAVLPRVSALSLSTLFILSAFSLTAHANNGVKMSIYKDKNGQALLTNVNPSGQNFQKYTKHVKTTYYKGNSSAGSYSNNYGSNSYGNATASSSGSRNAYDSYIRASAARHGVDPALMKAMMHTESAFNPNARSPVGAQGLMQLMPATARRFSVNNPWNPAENIEGSAKYIAWLMRRFNGNVEHAVAGYNAGEGNVDKYGGIPPFTETRNYVKNVMSRYHTLYKNDAGLYGGTMSASNNSTASSAMRNVSYGTSSNSASIGYANVNANANQAYAALR